MSSQASSHLSAASKPSVSIRATVSVERRAKNSTDRHCTALSMPRATAWKKQQHHDTGTEETEKKHTSVRNEPLTSPSPSTRGDAAIR